MLPRRSARSSTSTCDRGIWVTTTRTRWPPLQGTNSLMEPTSTVISIEGIRAMGRHGANPGEQLEPQEFVVDVDVWVEVSADSFDGTMDYRVVVDRVRETIAGPP